MSKVRINDLARELEVKSRPILDALEAIGVTGKTHSSSIETDQAERVRAHFTNGGRRTQEAPQPRPQANIVMPPPAPASATNPPVGPVIARPPVAVAPASTPPVVAAPHAARPAPAAPPVEAAAAAPAPAVAAPAVHTPTPAAPSPAAESPTAVDQVEAPAEPSAPSGVPVRRVIMPQTGPRPIY